MLDLLKLQAQVGSLSQHLQQESSATQSRLESARHAFEHFCQDPTLWQNRYEQWQSHLAFMPATPVSAVSYPFSPPSVEPWKQAHTVVATDGSQITPNHHEIAYCSLINIGRVGLSYGCSRWPWLDSVPILFYRSSDLGPALGLSSTDRVALRRTQAEITELSQLALTLKAQDPDIPLLTLVDGSLIYWALDLLPPDTQAEWLDPILNAYDTLQAARIPIVGYISASRSREVIHYLRLGLCPYLGCDCRYYCDQVSQPPCSLFANLTDRIFWSALLKPGEYSSLWRSGSRLLNSYRQHLIHFCYFHGGDEVARLEFPAWVMQEPILLQQALEMVLAQIQKGFGYPVALAEAHHLAVVKGGDRQQFFALLEQELIRSGLRNIAVSRKEAGKRTGIA
jgi:hypothetical protein